MSIATAYLSSTYHDRSQDRIDDWSRAIKPLNGLEKFIVGRAAVTSVEMEQLEEAETAERECLALRAEGCWDDDRAAEVAVLAEGLRKNPGKVSAKLRRTKHGAAWMRDRWMALGRALGNGNDNGNEWSPEQRILALDLLGIPEIERNGITCLDAATDSERCEIRKNIVSREHEKLRLAVNGPLKAIDDKERFQASKGLGIGRPGSMLALIRRQMAFAIRQLRWALDILRKNHRHAARDIEKALIPDPANDPGNGEHDDDIDKSIDQDVSEDRSRDLTRLLKSFGPGYQSQPHPEGNRHARRAEAARNRKK